MWNPNEKGDGIVETDRVLDVSVSTPWLYTWLKAGLTMRRHCLACRMYDMSHWVKIAWRPS